MKDDGNHDLGRRPSKQHVAETLRKTGYPHAADEALRVLPEQVNLREVEKFCHKQGILYDDLISSMGGSP